MDGRKGRQREQGEGDRGGKAASWGLVQGRWLGLLRPSNWRGEKEAKERRIETTRREGGAGGKGFFFALFLRLFLKNCIGEEATKEGGKKEMGSQKSGGSSGRDCKRRRRRRGGLVSRGWQRRREGGRRRLIGFFRGESPSSSSSSSFEDVYPFPLELTRNERRGMKEECGLSPPKRSSFLLS